MTKVDSHIVFLTPGFPKNEHDTQCIPALQIYLRALAERYKGKMTVIAFHYPYRKGSYSWHGVTVHALGGRNRRMTKPILLMRAKHKFNKIFKENVVTQIHSFWLGECCMVGAQVALKFGVPHICTAMGQEVRLGNRWVSRIGRAPSYVCLSKFQANALEDNYNLNSKIVPWGLSSAKPVKSKKTIDIIGVGSLISLKAFDQFISIIAELKNTFPQINCKIIGTGPERTLLEKQIGDLDLASNVELLGSLPYTETQQYMAKSKILLHPALFESFGMVVIEALSLGTNVVARAVGVAAEIPSVHKMNSIAGSVEQISEILKKDAEIRPITYQILETIKKYTAMYNIER